MERLYLVGNVLIPGDADYLHLQESDEGGFDYSLYDYESLTLFDGGQVDEPETFEAAIQEIKTMHFSGNAEIIETSIDILDKILEKN